MAQIGGQHYIDARRLHCIEQYLEAGMAKCFQNDAAAGRRATLVWSCTDNAQGAEP
ncbi:hypothetical protein [Sphingobium sp. D43FB]|uniref:hypothetical protein n=1 Tax=Sphingobium sp. D43FB TaxID=2017595 RepID=UPI00159698A4|nr:hypothetical protein [Sphingobium sp. D43FB]